MNFTFKKFGGGGKTEKSQQLLHYNQSTMIEHIQFILFSEGVCLNSKS